MLFCDRMTASWRAAVVAGCAVIMSCLGAVVGAEPAFKTARDAKPGDWARYETTTSGLGVVKQASILLVVLANNGSMIEYRATMTDLENGKVVASDYSNAVDSTIEGTLFNEVRVSPGDRLKNNPVGRETLLVAGYTFDCATFSATATGGAVQTDAKIWYSPQAPFQGLVKRETTSKAKKTVFGRPSNLSASYRTELKEWGDVSRPPSP